LSTSSEILHEETFSVEGKDYANAGAISLEIRKILSSYGFDLETIRRVAIVTFEAEINIALYAKGGEIRFRVFPDEIELEIEDTGPGIENIEMALQNGFSTATAEIRELGFGAGMGLPNIKKNADEFSISSTEMDGTRLSLVIRSEASRQNHEGE
jgi:anti-sigma regulatory factor (Ser/Thr protein kinase)